MNIINVDYKKGFAKLRVTELDDLWYLSHLVDPGDFVKGKTTRKMKIGDGENAKTVKKTLTLKVEAETIDFGAEGTTLRVNGLVKEGPENVPKDSHHTITLEEGSEFLLEKVNWMQYQKQKLKEASEIKYSYFLCLFDREEVLMALTKKFGYDILVKFKGEVPKKAKEVDVKKDFHEEIIKALEIYNDRYNPENIILASPAFYKEDLFKKIKLDELKKKIVLATCSSIDESALDEVIKRPELKNILRESRSREENFLVEELLQEINKDGAAVYGLVEVEKAINAGAVRELLITDEFIKIKKEKNEYDKLDQHMKTVDNLQGKIHIISSSFDSGKRIDGLGGVAAILRYILK